MIVLGVIAGLGILTRRAVLTKLSGGFGALFTIVFIIEMNSLDLGVGVFVSLFGSVLALAAGFMGTSKRR